MSYRKTYVVASRYAMHERRLEAARRHAHGVQVLTFELLAARLAGGFIGAADGDTLRVVLRDVLPGTALGELEPIKTLPGFVEAASDTLRKAWQAGIDLKARAGGHPRLAALAALEAAVLGKLPPAMLPPGTLVAAALARIAHAPALFGEIEIVGLTELQPCWRVLLPALAAKLPVCWVAGPRTVPGWLDRNIVEVRTALPTKPIVTVVSAATAHHEAIEAMRWARALLASGQAKPHEIALASASTADYDDHLLALRAESGLDVHFVHGIKVTATRPGQAAAALADILVRGLSQLRLRRLVALLDREPGPVGKLPQRWMQLLPKELPLTSKMGWDNFLAKLASDVKAGTQKWPDGQDHTAELRDLVGQLQSPIEQASAVGNLLLRGAALAIWHRALVAGPPEALDATLDSLKQDDGLEACVGVAWMPASSLAACPRRHVRLLGLNSSRWPRMVAEDRLLSDHIVPTTMLDPLPLNAADRRDFASILATSADTVVLSRARRDGDGRLLGRSALLRDWPTARETYLRRNAAPQHALSEADRLQARPAEFGLQPQAVSADACWRDWQSSQITPHDGLVGGKHPLLVQLLGQPQSASSLRKLLRDPLGFVWHYGLGWREPEVSEDPLVLDALQFGNLVHEILQRTVVDLEASGGVARATPAKVEGAVDRALKACRKAREEAAGVPPALIWAQTLDEARKLVMTAMTRLDVLVTNGHAFAEVAFGGAAFEASVPARWNCVKAVPIQGAGLNVRGYIDRLDIAGDQRSAVVLDYKTGKKPKNTAMILDGGKELQRCLYAYAVKALLGQTIDVKPYLYYLRDDLLLELSDPKSALKDLTGYLKDAGTSFTAGHCLIGPDSGESDLSFALPANAANSYCQRKTPAAAVLLANATKVWEAP